MRRLRALLVVFTVVLTAVTFAPVAVRTQAPDRSHPPQAGPPPALKLPALQRRALSNGLRVWIVEHHQVPIVQVNLVALSGTGDDPPGQFGIASLTASMLTEGAGRRSALEIADTIDFLGAELSATSGSDSSAVRLNVPAARLGDALAVMADVAQRPTFPEAELARQKVQRLTSILQARDDPASIGQLAFARVVYGDTHRYGTALAGSAQTIQGFTVADVRAFYEAAYQPANAAIVVVGDITASRVLPLLETHFGKWTPASRPAPHNRSLTEPPRQPRQIYIVDKPGAPQSQVRMGWVGVPRSTPDYFPITVMNTVLGGAFSSRLNLNLREKHGYTYGANSQFDMRLGAGPFLAAAGIQTDKTAEALKEFFAELEGIRQTVPEDELTRAKHYVSLRFPLGFETTGEIAGRLEQALVYHLPDDYFATYIQRIESVTAADVQRVAQKYIDPEHFAVVIAGDRAAIEPAVRALNVGPVKILTVDDIFGPAPTIGK
jgi:predicted Zn-dependent peptidase